MISDIIPFNTSSDFLIPFEKLTISAGELFASLAQLESVEDMVAGLADEVYLDLLENVEAKAYCNLIDPMLFRPLPDHFYIDTIRFSCGKIIAKQILGCDTVALFLATTGSYCEEKAEECFRNCDFLKGYIYDVAGSVIAEAAAAEVSAYVRGKAEKGGLEITNRYSPGYCNWDVAEQHLLFPLLKGNKTGVELLDSSMMLPKKSIAGIIGVGKDASQSAYPCDICSMNDCYMRRKVENNESL
jgi:hypothetical protein